jgi:hypothetical protein
MTAKQLKRILDKHPKWTHAAISKKYPVSEGRVKSLREALKKG